MSIELQSQPRSGQKHRQAEKEQPYGLARDRSLGAEPYRADGEYRDRDRLEDGALLILRPTAYPAPYGDNDAGKPGQAAEHAIEESDGGIGRRAARLDRLERRPNQGVNAVKHQQDTDGHSHVLGPRPAQDGNSDRRAEGAAEQEWP